jgi:hypothetical protein
VLAAQLVIEGALAMIRGEVKGKAPVEPAVVSPEERAKLGLPRDNLTLFYPAGESGVFLDMGGNTFTVWFTGEDCEKATSALHERLTRAFPKTRQLDDVPHPKNKHMRARVYRTELGDGRLAAISTSFSRLASGQEKFTVRVIAQQRR